MTVWRPACSRPQQIPAIGPGVISAVNDDPFQGVVLSYQGSVPTLNDPWSCPTNPSTGNAYPRQTEMVFTCDPQVAGYAVLDSVTQNTTDSCDYTLRFRTDLVCFVGGRADGALILPLSSGWIFMTALLGCFAIYALGGIAWGYARTKRISFPNLAFWLDLQDLIFEGVIFAFSCGRWRLARGSISPTETVLRPRRTVTPGSGVSSKGGSGFKAAGTRVYTDL